MLPQSMYETPLSHEFTQGTIFSCAYAENYPDVSVYGIVITARCDVAQNKTPIYSYIPVVAIVDWIIQDGYEIAMRRAVSNHEGSLKQILLESELSTTLLQTISLEEIYRAHFEPRKNDKAFRKKCDDFIGHIDSIRRIEKSLEHDFDVQERKETLLKYPKLIDALIKELVSNRLTGYYLLKDMPTIAGDSEMDYVALLREIHHIPTLAAQFITKGASPYDLISGVSIPGNCPRFVSNDDFSMPICRIKSPWIEHLMQTLTLLFSRIGVEDIDAQSVKKSLSSIGL